MVSILVGCFVGLLNNGAISSMDLSGVSMRCERRKTSIGQLGLFSYIGKRSGLSSGDSIVVFVKASLKSVITGVPLVSS